MKELQREKVTDIGEVLKAKLNICPYSFRMFHLHPYSCSFPSTVLKVSIYFNVAFNS